VCGSETRVVFRVKQAFTVRECATCTHRFAECQTSDDHITAVYGDDYFFGGGAGYPDYFEEEKILRAHGRRYAELLRRHAPNSGKRLLDVGGACGFISDGFRSQGWQPHVVEPNPRMAAYAREKLNFDAHTGTLDTFPASPLFDVVIMIQVIAHFPDVHTALAKAAANTREGGYWLIETWNCRSWTARLFGRHWHEYNPPSVLNFFSTKSLRTLAAQFGFIPIATGHPRKNIMWRHGRALLNHQIPWAWFHRITGLIPDEAVLPYPAEDLYWMLLKHEPNVLISPNREEVLKRTPNR
jgi:2-polyprenyl-3-methyl-5-hydroxy-6-metoxy-1,4-benzoquinol methylase